jgi:hypothetical protein
MAIPKKSMMETVEESNENIHVKGTMEFGQNVKVKQRLLLKK